MKSIVCTYPDFRELPKAIKQMLVVSETLFFEDAFTPSENTGSQSRHEIANHRLWLPPQKQYAATGYAAFAA
jgi:hypothetical protein